MKSENFEQYHEYLKRKSFLGNIYRKFLLYPALHKHTVGLALDIGCGTGEYCRSRPNTHGADINPLNVNALLKSEIPGFLIKGDTLPCGDEAYDSVIMDNVLEHIAHPEPIMAEVRRVLRPRGRLIIGVPGIKGFLGEEDHKVFYDKKNLNSFINSHGFSTLKIFHMPIKSDFFDRHLRQYCLYGIFQKVD